MAAKPLKYLSVCSGIEAATVAWHPLGWQLVALSEIEPFPCSVLAHHYPTVPNFGDMTKFKEWPDATIATIDILVGGTPCQSFSVAGLRKGLDDPRGNLMLTYLAVINKTRPKWVVYENVPGILSADGGTAFGTLLGGLAELGYGFAYRILDAVHAGVPQRRRRVFVVGYIGDWRRAAAVLFERHSLSGNPPPSRKTWKEAAGSFTDGTGLRGGMQSVAPTLSARTKGGGGLGTDFDCDGGLVAHTLNSKGGSGRIDAESETFIPTIAPTLRAGGNSTGGHRPYGTDVDTADSLISVVAIHPHCIGRDAKSGPQGKEYMEGGSAYTMDSRGSPQAVAFDLRGREGGAMPEGAHDTANIRATNGGSSRSYVCAPVAFNSDQSEKTRSMGERKEQTPTLMAGGEISEVRMMDVAGVLASQPGMKQQTFAYVNMVVRRLTPEECEALQGFPRGYTNVPHRNKPAADGPRYKALGNSMAVPVMAWIGQRIAMVDAIGKA